MTETTETNKTATWFQLGQRCYRCNEITPFGTDREALQAGWEIPVYIQTSASETLQTVLCPQHASRGILWRLRRRNDGLGTRIGAAGRILAPGYSACERCHTPWAFVEAHSTMIGNGVGMFPLCQLCWHEIATPVGRLPFYKRLWDLWDVAEYHGIRWNDIVEAVLTEDSIQPR